MKYLSSAAQPLLVALAADMVLVGISPDRITVGPMGPVVGQGVPELVGGAFLV